MISPGIRDARIHLDLVTYMYDLELVYDDTIPDDLVSIPIPGLVHAGGEVHLGGLGPDLRHLGPDQDLGLEALDVGQLSLLQVTRHAGGEPQDRRVLVPHLAG